MTKVIVSQFDIAKEEISKNNWGIFHNVMLVNEEDIPTYLNYVAASEGYSSVKAYLESNPLWKFSLDGGAKVAITTPV